MNPAPLQSPFFRRDGDVTTGDLVVAFQNGGEELGSRGANAVPEPASFVLLMAGSMAIVARRRH